MILLLRRRFISEGRTGQEVINSGPKGGSVVESRTPLGGQNLVRGKSKGTLSRVKLLGFKMGPCLLHRRECRMGRSILRAYSFEGKRHLSEH